MILNDEDVTERMESPINLMNRLKELSSSSRRNFLIPSLPPNQHQRNEEVKADDIISDIDGKLAVGSIKTKAASILLAAMKQLQERLPEIQKAEKLADIADKMSKVVYAKDPEKEAENLKQGQIIIYAPQHHVESHYETIQVNDMN